MQMGRKEQADSLVGIGMWSGRYRWSGRDRQMVRKG
jgi:hypothetical protein